MPPVCLEPLLVIAIRAREHEEWQIGAIESVCKSHFQAVAERVRGSVHCL